MGCPVRASLALALYLGAAAAAVADEPGATSEPAIVFIADTLTYDSSARVVHASGHVQANRNGRTLVADEVSYDEVNDRATAKGNITLFEPTGEVIFADEVELSGDLKDGVIENLRAVLSDGARLAAANAERAGGNVTTAHRAVYSPCFSCPADPDRPLIWQVKAVKVVHQQEDKIIEFYEAQLEIADIPVFWLPYFYTPDPTVERKSGFLIPTFGNSGELGFFAQVPYFWAISPQEDVTITPWFMTEEGLLLEGQYRRALKQGSIRTQGMITNDSDGRTRGAIDSAVRYDIDETWRAGLTATRTTNSTFLRIYGNDDRRTLTSRAYAEAFSERNYFVANVYGFQGMDPDDRQNVIPWAAPWLDYSIRTRPDALGGITDVRLDALALTREDGLDTRRLSARGGYSVPQVGPLGDVYTLSASVWADGYNVNNLDLSNANDRFDGSRGRLFPQAGLSWRLPFMRTDETVSQIIEPRAEIIAAPNYGNPNRIPNEDSQDFEFDYANVFGMSRQPGLDRVEKGPRVNYGLNYEISGNTGGSASVFVGQVYRFREDNSFPNRSGLNTNVSDVVSAVQLSPNSYLDLIYSNRLNNDDLDPVRHELTTLAGVDALNASVTYVRLQGEPDNDLPFREEVGFGLNSKLTRHWRSRVFGTRDLQGSGSWRSIGARLMYEDECFFFGAEFRRRDINDGDVDSSNAIFVRLGFKTLGDIGAGYKP